VSGWPGGGRKTADACFWSDPDGIEFVISGKIRKRILSGSEIALRNEETRE